MTAVITPENAPEIIGQYMLRDVLPVVVDLDRSSGNRLYDAKGKRFLLDCFSYVASNPVGHNHPKLSAPEFERKLLRVAKAKPTNSDFYTVEMAEFIATFARVAMPAQLQHLFLVEGGALAVENALKAAFDWKIRLNKRRGFGAERGTKVLHLVDAFHGRTGYTLSLTNTADARKTKFFPKFDWPRIPSPKIRFPLSGSNLAAVIAAEEEAIAAAQTAFAREGDDICAIIIEPIQAEGGDNHFRPEFHQALRVLADEHEAMLIYDEVQSGLGLTGKMWAYEHFDIVPDAIAFGKKTQVCGMLFGKRIDDVEDNVFEEASRLNSTWGGNLTDMVRCQRYLEIIEEERLVDNAARVGAVLLRGLRELEERRSELLSNARGRGLMCAIDLTTPAARDRAHQEMFRRGALVLRCGTRSLRFRPSLTFSEAEATELLAILDEAAGETA